LALKVRIHNWKKHIMFYQVVKWLIYLKYLSCMFTLVDWIQSVKIMKCVFLTKKK